MVTVLVLLTHDNQVPGVTLQQPQEWCNSSYKGVSKDSPYRCLPAAPQPHTWPPATQNCHFLVQPLSFCLVFKAGAQQTLGSVRHTPCSAVPAGSCPAWDIPHLQWEGLGKVSLHEMLFYLLLKVVSDYSSLPPNCAIRPQVHRSSFSIPCHHKPIDTRNL